MSVIVLLTKSMRAIALFSCNETHAVSLLALTAIYSGSISWAKLALGPKIRRPFAISSAFMPANPAKFKVVTA